MNIQRGGFAAPLWLDLRRRAKSANDVDGGDSGKPAFGKRRAKAGLWRI